MKVVSCSDGKRRREPVEGGRVEQLEGGLGLTGAAFV